MITDTDDYLLTNIVPINKLKLKVMVIVNNCVGVTLKYYQLIIPDIIYTMPVTVLTDCAQG